MKQEMVEMLMGKAMELYDRAFNQITGLAAKGVIADNNDVKTMYCEEITRMAYWYMDEARYELPKPLAVMVERQIDDLKCAMKISVHNTYKNQAPKRKSLFA